MRKYLLHILLAGMFFSMPGFLGAVAATEFPEMELSEEIGTVQVSVSGTNVRALNASGAVLEVYSITGVRVFCQKIESNDKTVSLSSLGKGCYIVKVGKLARKISIF